MLQLVLLIAGLVTVCAGLAWIYPPAGIVTVRCGRRPVGVRPVVGFR